MDEETRRALEQLSDRLDQAQDAIDELADANDLIARALSEHISENQARDASMRQLLQALIDSQKHGQANLQRQINDLRQLGSDD